MIGLGTIINSVSIIAGGIIGHFTGRLFKTDQQDALTKTCGISVLFIAIAGAMEGMLRIENGAISGGKSMLVVLCLALGTIIGEMIGIEKGFERFGEWLKEKTGNSKDKNFVNAFVTSSLTVCIGAMAIVGAIQDGTILIFCVGLNLVWGKKVRVANMLPAVILAILTAYLPWGF